VRRTIRTEPQWTSSDIPCQEGRVAVVTGGNSGVGFETALALAWQKAAVVLACRNLDKAKRAADRIAEAVPRASVDVAVLDLSSLASVAEAAAMIARRYDQLDLLINNAGVMWPPHTVTEQGVELQFATNHLGHFALTGHLLKQLLATPGSRIVTLSSLAHHVGRLSFDDLAAHSKYRPVARYNGSKLANLLFTLQLQRRLTAAGSGTLSVAAHPGATKSELVRHDFGFAGSILRPQVLAPMLQYQSAAMGALPTLRAATDPTAMPGDYFGPGRFCGFTGNPSRARIGRRATDRALQERLWTTSENLTGVVYPI
jgi:NAD(P)-dependent dehydrogenase (short-subunit alcohol dehydrogenase family)